MNHLKNKNSASATSQRFSSLNFLFFVKDFQKLDAQVSDLEALSHFENLFEHFDFSVMGEGSRLHAGEPPALHIASD